MPRESETATGERVVIQGVGGNVVSVPLYQISLDSEIGMWNCNRRSGR